MIVADSPRTLSGSGRVRWARSACRVWAAWFRTFEALLAGGIVPCRTARNRTGATTRARMVTNLLYRPGYRPASRIRSENPVPVILPCRHCLLRNRGGRRVERLPFSHVRSQYSSPSSIGGTATRSVRSRTEPDSWAGGIRTRDLRIKRPVLCPLSYSPAHAHRHDRPDMRDAFTIALWCCRRWRVFDRSDL